MIPLVLSNGGNVVDSINVKDGMHISEFSDLIIIVSAFAFWRCLIICSEITMIPYNPEIYISQKNIWIL